MNDKELSLLVGAVVATAVVGAAYLLSDTERECVEPDTSVLECDYPRIGRETLEGIRNLTRHKYTEAELKENANCTFIPKEGADAVINIWQDAFPNEGMPNWTNREVDGIDEYEPISDDRWIIKRRTSLLNATGLKEGNYACPYHNPPEEGSLPQSFVSEGQRRELRESQVNVAYGRSSRERM